MKIIAVLCAALCLASCYAADPAVGPRPSVQDVSGRPVAIAPTGSRLANPAVVTSGGILAYHRDLRSCRAVADRKDGGPDDIAAIRRALQSRPLDGSVSVSYRPGDVALDRDRVVKECLSQRGYAVQD